MLDWYGAYVNQVSGMLCNILINLKKQVLLSLVGI